MKAKSGWIAAVLLAGIAWPASAQEPIQPTPDRTVAGIQQRVSALRARLDLYLERRQGGHDSGAAGTADQREEIRNSASPVGFRGDPGLEGPRPPIEEDAPPVVEPATPVPLQEIDEEKAGAKMVVLFHDPDAPVNHRSAAVAPAGSELSERQAYGQAALDILRRAARNTRLARRAD